MSSATGDMDIRSGSMESTPVTSSDGGMNHLYQQLRVAQRRQVEALGIGRETEIPDVFTMPVSPKKLVSVRVQRVRTADFVFVDDNL